MVRVYVVVHVPVVVRSAEVIKSPRAPPLIGPRQLSIIKKFVGLQDVRIKVAVKPPPWVPYNFLIEGPCDAILNVGPAAD